MMSNMLLICRYRWGDSTLQAMAVRLFMKPSAVRQIPNISYHHISHQNKMASSVPHAEVSIPQVFKDGNGLWTEDPALSDLRLVMKKPPAMPPATPSAPAPVVVPEEIVMNKKSGAGGGMGPSSKRIENLLRGRMARYQGKKAQSKESQ